MVTPTYVASQPSPPCAAPQEEEGRATVPTCHQGAWGRESSECPSAFPGGPGISPERCLPRAPPSAACPCALGTGFSPKPWHRKEAQVHACPVPVCPPGSCGEGLLLGLYATHLVTAASCPAAGLLLQPQLPFRAASLMPSSRKRCVTCCDGWCVPLKSQETDVEVLGYGWSMGLRCPALREGAGENFTATGINLPKGIKGHGMKGRSPGYPAFLGELVLEFP